MPRMKLVGLFLCIACGSRIALAQTRNPDVATIRGTVNVVLANLNGIVVLTDSKQTVVDSAGRAVGTQNGQKLIRLDDNSVCAVAGFGNGTVNGDLKFDADVMGILADLRDQLGKQKGRLSFYEKLRVISFLAESYIDVYANMAEVLQPGQLKPKDLYFSLFLAGYDSDETLKIGSLELRASPNASPSGKRRWTFGTPDIQTEPVGASLSWRLGGMWDVGKKILTKPSGYLRSPAVRRYSEAIKDNGASLSLPDLKALAKFIAGQTAHEHPQYVGGADQIAIIRDGRVAAVDEPPSAAPPKPLQFLVFMDIPMYLGGPLLGPKGAATIWIRDEIVSQMPLALDGNFFLGNEIRDSILVYNGGQTVFQGNDVRNSRLQFGPDFVGNPDDVRKVIQPFPWSYCYPFGCTNQQLF